MDIKYYIHVGQIETIFGYSNIGFYRFIINSFSFTDLDFFFIFYKWYFMQGLT